MTFSDDLLDVCGKPAWGKPSAHATRRVWVLVTFDEDGTISVTTRAGTTGGWTAVNGSGLRLRASDAKTWRLVADLVQRSSSGAGTPRAATGYLYRYDHEALEAIARAAKLAAGPPARLAWFGKRASAAWIDGWHMYREWCISAARQDAAEAQRLFADHWLEFYWALEGALVAVSGARSEPYELAVKRALDAVFPAA
jgi:hypothetical protein